MLVAITRLLAKIIAQVVGNTSTLFRANNLTHALPTVAYLTDDLKAVVAGTLVAEVLTIVGAAVQPLLTHPLAGELLPTLHSLFFLGTWACNQDGGRTGRTGTGMAEVHTGVETRLRPRPSAHLPAGVRHQTLVPFPFWVSEFSTETTVLVRQTVGNRLTTRAPPASRLCAGGLSPLLYTV